MITKLFPRPCKGSGYPVEIFGHISEEVKVLVSYSHLLVYAALFIHCDVIIVGRGKLPGTLGTIEGV